MWVYVWLTTSLGFDVIMTAAPSVAVSNNDEVNEKEVLIVKGERRNNQVGSEE
jgi:hypothetical protein